MANLKVKDGGGVDKYIAKDGAGTDADPYIEPVFVADETNVRAEYLTNGGSEDQTVDGSVTPVTFSSTVVPVGKVFIAQRVIIYMEGATDFSSNKFGDLTALTNGWTLAINGVEAMSAKTNRELVSYMFDAHGSEIFGKVKRTFIARFSFNKFTNGADGITIREGETLDTIVKDDLTGLTYLEVRVQGVYKDA